MRNEIHCLDIGVNFLVTIKDGDNVVNISSATTKQLIFQKPSGSNLTKDATFYTNGTDGILSYVSIDGDLDEVGFWKVQGYIVLGSNEWHTDIADFRVHRNL